jgi:DNA-binding transcriptional ArsR family regulator
MDKFHALSDPTRRQIVELLSQRGQLSATEIAGQFPVSPQAISQHLKILREAGLVQVEKRAQQRIYRVNPQAMLELEDWARRLRQLWSQRFDALEEVLEEEKKRLKGEAYDNGETS